MSDETPGRQFIRDIVRHQRRRENWGLYNALQEDLTTEAKKDADDGTIDTLDYWRERCLIYEERYALAQQILQHSSNRTLRYFRLRRRVLLWWKRLRG